MAAPTELVSPHLRSRAPTGAHFYRKVGPRRAQAISKVCFAGVRRAARRTRHRASASPWVALRPCPYARIAAEQAIVAGEPFAQVQRAFDAAIAPIDDVRSSARYRRRVAANLLGEFLAHVGLAS